MRTVAILPVKRFDRAKQRLGAALGQPARAQLVEAMVGDVLDVLVAVDGLHALLMVTSEPRAAVAASERGVELIEEPAADGQSAAAKLGIARALALDAERTLLVPGDCPAMTAPDIAALLRHEEQVVIVPDRHGSGTNALLLTPPGAIEPAFGPDSRRRHERLAGAASVSWALAPIASLSLDIDTPEDLAALRPRPGSRTAEALDRLDAALPLAAEHP